MKFTARVLLSGKSATGVEVPPEVVDALGGGRRPKVKATIGDYSYRNSVAPMNGTFMLSISAEVRNATGVAAGDLIEVDLVLDTEPRELSVPDDFAHALTLNPAAEQFFTSLSYSLRRAHVDPINSAKSPETRRRRIAKSITLLAQGKAR
jgi:hypothetical protein